MIDLNTIPKDAEIQESFYKADRHFIRVTGGNYAGLDRQRKQRL